jgi:exosortase
MMSANMIAADVGQSIQEPGANAFYTLWHQRQSKATLWALAAATLVFGLAYYQNFRVLYAIWSEDQNYSHGRLIIPIAVWILWRCLAGCKLQLISSVNDVRDIPREGKRLIILAVVDQVLHFRIFDRDGEMVVNTDAKRLTKHARPIEDLKKQLTSLWPPHELTKSEQVRVIDAVESIVGHTRLAGAEPSPGAVPAPWWGWVFLTAVLAARAIAYELNLQVAENATILPAIACLTWTFGGWPLLRRTWLAIAYLVFMLPLPQTINNLIALPLQSIATSGSCFLLQLSGMWAIQEGNVINLDTPHGMMPLDVALACNGLRMLMTMVATVVAILILMPLPTWKRIVLLISVVPIALLSNIIRIATTGWCYYLITGPRAKDWAHDLSGWLMMPLALVLVWRELSLLSWLVPDEDEPGPDDGKLVLPMLTQGLGKKKMSQDSIE